MLKIAQLGQPVLRRVSLEVPKEEILTPALHQLIVDMRETLAKEGGVGLAAPQVFEGKRLFLAAVIPPANPDDMPGLEVMINPQMQVLSQSRRRAWEGCLSFPELLIRVPRFVDIRISFFDAQAQPRVLVLHDFPARVVQHELDHLDGILTLDRAESTRHIIKASEIDAVVKKNQEKSE